MIPLAVGGFILGEEALATAGAWLLGSMAVVAGADQASKAISKAKEKADEKDCRCPAAGSCQGKYSPNLRSDKSYAGGKPDSWLRYQLRIANMKAGPEKFAALPSGTKDQYQVTEWSYNGIPDFDGFWRAQCTLVEAKGNYDQFIGKPWVDMRWWRSQLGTEGMLGQMRRHHRAATPPPVRVEWHFMGNEVYKLLSQNFGTQVAALAPQLTTHYTP